MKKILSVFLSIFLLIFGISSCSKNPQTILLEQLNEEMPYLLEHYRTKPIDHDTQQAISNFSTQLFREMLQDDTKNLVFSPFAAYLSLSMASLGAHTDTRSDFREVLGAEPAALAVSFHDLALSLKDNPQNFTSQIAASIWLDQSFTPAEDFSAWMQAYFRTPVELHDFSVTETLDAAEHWLAANNPALEDTEFHRAHLSESNLFLLSTLNLSADWADALHPISLVEDTFIAEGSRTSETPFLETVPHNISLLQSDTLQAALLPFAGEALGLLLICSLDEEIPLRTLIAEKDFRDIFPMLSPHDDTKIRLPLLDQTFHADFSIPLQNMRLNDPFHPRLADLSGLVQLEDTEDEEEEKLLLSSVLQQIRFVLHEDGIAYAPNPAVEASESEISDNTLTFGQAFWYIVYDFSLEIPLIMGIFEG